MAQQTAVEWLENVYNTQGHILPAQFEQANQIFEEQIKYAHLTGLIHPLEMEASKQAEQYYNETFGNNNKNK